jgi:3-oxoacyl-[acyl-carrier protein] reductase
MGWESQVAVVTGSSRGAIALKLASCGAAVCINYVAQRDMAEQVVADIQTAGGRSIAVGADIGDPAQAATLLPRRRRELAPSLFW